MNTMRRLDSRGELSVAVLGLIFTVLLLLATGGFAAWAFSQYQDYKQNTDEKISAAVATAKQATVVEEQNKYNEVAKSPFKTYAGPETYGSVKLDYPKTWSAYADGVDKTTNPVDTYFQPNVVGSVKTNDNTYALRVQVAQQSYAAAVKAFDAASKSGAVKVSPYALPKVPDVIGVRIDGAINKDKQGSMVILPLRDKSVKFWTESKDYATDFDTILQSTTFSP